MPNTTQQEIPSRHPIPPKTMQSITLTIDSTNTGQKSLNESKKISQADGIQYVIPAIEKQTEAIVKAIQESDDRQAEQFDRLLQGIRDSARVTSAAFALTKAVGCTSSAEEQRFIIIPSTRCLYAESIVVGAENIVAKGRRINSGKGGRRIGNTVPQKSKLIFCPRVAQSSPDSSSP